MKIRLGTLRRLIREEAWVPGRPMVGDGDSMSPDDVSRLGEPDGMPAVDETDDRMEGDGKGNGFVDPDEPNDDMAGHLRTGEEKVALGDPTDVNEDIARFFLQEQDDQGTQSPPGEPAGATGPDRAGSATSSSADAAKALQRGFYTDFDMTRDHTGTDDLSSTWYRSPGRPAGGDGDPFRSADPYAQLGFHPPAGPDDPGTAPPGATGETGAESLDAPEDESLKTKDTSELGADEKGSTEGVGSDDGSQEKSGARGEGTQTEGARKKPRRARPQRR